MPHFRTDGANRRAIVCLNGASLAADQPLFGNRVYVGDGQQARQAFDDDIAFIDEQDMGSTVRVWLNNGHIYRLPVS